MHNRTTNVLAFVIVLWMILSSGAEIIGYNETMHVIVLIVLYLMFFMFNRTQIKIQKRALVSVGLLSILVFINITNDLENFSVSLLNFDLGFLSKLWITLLIASTMNYKLYSRHFVNIIFALSAVSLVFYFSFLLKPGLINGLPSLNIIKANYNYIFYVYNKEQWGLDRNYSIFWEPGAFQGFITLALVMLLFADQKIFSAGRKLVYASIFIIATITTFSTTGYIVLLIVFIAYSLKNLRVLPYTLLLGLIFYLAFDRAILNNVLFQKFNKEGIWSTSGERRISDVFVEIDMVKTSPVFGVGYHTYFTKKGITLSMQGIRETWEGGTNSMTYLMALFGIPFLSLLVWGLFNFVQFIEKRKEIQIILFFSIVILLMGEVFLAKVAFQVIIFYGLNRIRSPRKKHRLNGHISTSQ
jgi:hypothetical protein